MDALRTRITALFDRCYEPGKNELRILALSLTDATRALHITFTLRKSRQLKRVISARDMHRKQSAIYEQANK
jgi:uncharacterized DUF497 family protein